MKTDDTVQIHQMNLDFLRFNTSSKSADQSCTKQLRIIMCNALNPIVVRIFLTENDRFFDRRSLQD